MTVNENNQKRSAFSEWQLTVLVMIAGMGGMYFYPESFGRWSGISLAAAIALALLSMGMLARSFALSQSKSFPGLLRELLGYIPAKIILIGAAVYFASEIEEMSEPRTGIETRSSPRQRLMDSRAMRWVSVKVSDMS